MEIGDNASSLIFIKFKLYPPTINPLSSVIYTPIIWACIKVNNEVISLHVKFNHKFKGIHESIDMTPHILKIKEEISWALEQENSSLILNGRTELDGDILSYYWLDW